MMRKLRYAGGLAMLAALTGCPEFMLGVGGCEHTYRDPLLTIATVTSSATGVNVPRVVLSDFTVLGQPTSAQMLMLLLGDQARRVAVEDGTLICDVACAFGTSEGRYEFVVSAPGYVPTTVQLDARYRRFEGGCPSYNAGTNRLTIRMTPQ